MNDSEYVYVFMDKDDTYGEFLKSNSGQFDADGNMFPRTAKVDFSLSSGRAGKYIKAGAAKYIKAKERMFDANRIAGFTSGTATAAFSFGLTRESNTFAKIKKCGVHLLYTQEAERFGYVKQIEFESNGDEAIHSESNKKENEEDIDSGESESSGSEAIFEQKADEEEDGRESKLSGDETINPADQEEDDGGQFESGGREAIYSESNQEEHDEPLRIMGCWSGFRWLLERFCLFRSGGCWNG